MKFAPKVSRSTSTVGALLCSICLVLVASCSSSTSGSDGGSQAHGIALTNANNYTATSKLTIPSVQTTDGADLKICWNTISKDILCHTVDSSNSIDNVAFLQIGNPSQTVDQIEQALGLGKQPNVVTYAEYHTADAPSGQNCVMLSQMTRILDNGKPALDPSQTYKMSGGFRYMLLFTHGTTLGTGARAMTFLEPGAGSATTVNAPDGCNPPILDFQADLTGPTHLTIPANGPYVVDWSGITRDGLGNDVVFQKIDSLVVGFYQGKSVTDLQNSFLDLDTIATSFYSMSLSAGVKYHDLTGAMDTMSSDVFPTGFDRTDGIWVFGLRCSTCALPAPIAISVVDHGN